MDWPLAQSMFHENSIGWFFPAFLGGAVRECGRGSGGHPPTGRHPRPGPRASRSTARPWTAGGALSRLALLAELLIPAEPKIPGNEAFHNTDVPCVYQLPGQPDKWYMSFIAFKGQGYNRLRGRSYDLIHWNQPRLAMGFGKPGEFRSRRLRPGGLSLRLLRIRARAC